MAAGNSSVSFVLEFVVQYHTWVLQLAQRHFDIGATLEASAKAFVSNAYQTDIDRNQRRAFLQTFLGNAMSEATKKLNRPLWIYVLRMTRKEKERLSEVMYDICVKRGVNYLSYDVGRLSQKEGRALLLTIMTRLGIKIKMY